MSDRQSMTTRLREIGVRMECGPAKRTQDDDGWEHDAYRVRLTRAGQTMTLTFRKGTGHQGSPPSLAEVFESLASDSATLANADGFEEWARDLGYDDDSRKAEQTHRAVVKQDKDLRQLLTAEQYEALLWETDAD